MRFLQHQDRARRQSRLLLFVFSILLGLISLGICAVIWLAVFFTRDFHEIVLVRGYWHYFPYAAAATVITVGGAALYEHMTLVSQGAVSIANQLGGRLLSASRAKTLSETQLLNIVNEISIAALHKPPLVYVLDNEPSINAFAAGSEEMHFVLGVTEGALKLLNREELQGLVAHEMSHIVEGDAQLNMQLSSLNYGLTWLHNLGQWCFELQSFRMGIVGGCLLVLGWIGVAAGRILQAAISREREYLADAGAVRFTRNSVGISSTLRKIAAQAKVEPQDAKLNTPFAAAFGHAFFCTAYARGDSGIDAEADTDFLAGLTWLETHPPLGERIRRLLYKA